MAPASVLCPTCAAGPGEPCVSPSLAPGSFHKDRMALATLPHAE